MKLKHRYKRAAASLLLLTCLLVLSACSKNNGTTGASTTPSPSSVAPTSSEVQESITLQPSQEPSAEAAASVTAFDEQYKMEVYTDAPNKNSSVKIQYPSFSGNGAEALNAIIYDKVQGFAKIDTSVFSGDDALTVDYQSAVTLHNSKMVSILFWGTSYMENGAYPVSNLFTLNIDLQNMKEIILKDLYNTDADFEKVFFEKAFFPENPTTSYDKDSFSEMLKLQTPEYQTVDPFSIEGNVAFYLKPEGIVLSMPAVHATGSDHFEAELKYGDVQKYYLPKQNYWEE